MKIYKNLDDVTDFLRQGKVGILPSDTIYGLATSAANESAVQRLYEIKHREGKPGTIIAANVDQLVALGLKRRYLTAVERYWPGAVSVVIPCFDLAYLHLGKGSVPVRIPKEQSLRDFLIQTGPLQTSSANMPGEPVATTVEQAQGYFSDTVDFYVDGEDLSKNEASTVIRVVDDAVEVVRQGAVKIDEETGRITS